MKLLVVSTGDTLIGFLKELGEKLGFKEVKITTHENALADFLSYEPTSILFIEDMGKFGERFAKLKESRQIFQDLKASSLPGQRFVRCGGISLEEETPDYIAFPSLLDVKRLRELLVKG